MCDPTKPDRSNPTAWAHKVTGSPCHAPSPLTTSYPPLHLVPSPCTSSSPAPRPPNPSMTNGRCGGDDNADGRLKANRPYSDDRHTGHGCPLS